MANEIFFWEYTLTHRIHWISDGKMYSKGMLETHTRWAIKAIVDGYGSIHRKEDGYDLYWKSKMVMHALSVKELKQYVISVEEQQGNKVFNTYFESLEHRRKLREQEDARVQKPRKKVQKGKA